MKIPNLESPSYYGTYATIAWIYEGSDGAKTKALYDHLHKFGRVGAIAVNVFRAAKYSERAKIYRGGIRGKGSYKDMAYASKQWAMTNLCSSLANHDGNPALTWGWKVDPIQPFHSWVLYVDLPTGQVSFHTDRRGIGPDYSGVWDGKTGVSPSRICQWCAQLIDESGAV